MNEGPIDPRIDKMVAFLYGELSDAEERAFRLLLERDEGLRRDLEEIRSSREILSGWSLEERVPSFVLMEADRGEARSPGGWWERLFAPLRGLAVSPAWGLAATALILLVLAVAGLRVEPLGNGIAFRFGEPTPVGEPALEPVRSPVSGTIPTAFSASSDYMTRSEFESYNAELMRSLVSLLNDYDARREQEITGLIRTVYDRVSSQQTYDTEQLNQRINVLGRELVIDRNRYARSLDDLLRGSDNEPANLELSPAGQSEE